VDSRWQDVIQRSGWNATASSPSQSSAWCIWNQIYKLIRTTKLSSSCAHFCVCSRWNPHVSGCMDSQDKSFIYLMSSFERLWISWQVILLALLSAMCYTAGYMHMLHNATICLSVAHARCPELFFVRFISSGQHYTYCPNISMQEIKLNLAFEICQIGADTRACRFHFIVIYLSPSPKLCNVVNVPLALHRASLHCKNVRRFGI
jgi:hypothetical protein